MINRNRLTLEQTRFIPPSVHNGKMKGAVLVANRIPYKVLPMTLPVLHLNLASSTTLHLLLQSTFVWTLLPISLSFVWTFGGTKQQLCLSTAVSSLHCPRPNTTSLSLLTLAVPIIYTATVKGCLVPSHA